MIGTSGLQVIWTVGYIQQQIKNKYLPLQPSSSLLFPQSSTPSQTNSLSMHSPLPQSKRSASHADAEYKKKDKKIQGILKYNEAKKKAEI